MNKALVSIICTNFNKGDWIKEALDSFLQQKTTFHFEILVIDDASTDQSKMWLKEYEQRYPDCIRVIYNKTNQGIVKSWKTICPLATGDYIARCDGDDVWHDENKLQKQIDSLLAQPEYKWCCTDFDLIDHEGNILERSLFQNNIIPLADSFEKMLATRGFTMPSSWLIERKLLCDVTERISDLTADDTFDLQLELYKETKLLFLPESTTYYREHQDSDSRPSSLERFKERNNKLRLTQLYYLDNPPAGVNYKSIAKELINLDAFHTELSEVIKREFQEFQNQSNAQQEELRKIIAYQERVLNEREKLLAQFEVRVGLKLNKFRNILFPIKKDKL